jgi:tetratricopeptide (TPR) repeat protein
MRVVSGLVRILHATILVGWVSLAAAVPVRAQVAPSLAEAKQHFERGMQAFAQHDYRAAVEEFEAALARAPSAELWFNLARAHEELGDYEAARLAYERYLRDSVDAPDAPNVRVRMAELAGLDAERRRAGRADAANGHLRVVASVDAATVMLDGRPVGHVPIVAPLSLQSGDYRLDVLHPGYLPFRSKVQVASGMVTQAEIDLTPIPRSAANRPTRTWAWVSFGLTGALLVTSGALLAVAIAQERADPTRASGLEDGAGLALGGAALCALATAIVYVAEGAPERATVAGTARAKQHRFVD